MGIHDRDYYRNEPRSGLGGPRAWSVTTWLIVLCVAVFVIDALIWRATLPMPSPDADPDGMPMTGDGPLYHWGYFSLDQAVFHLQLWRFITFQFLHSGLWHLAFNMIGLYFFGPMVEAYLGVRRYLAFYLLCGIAGPLCYALLWYTGVLAPLAWTALRIQNAAVPMVGASAGIFAVLVAAAWMFPNMIIQLWFPPIPIKLKFLVWIMLGFAAWNVLMMGGNSGGDAAHLGGAALGFLLIRNKHWLAALEPKRRFRPRMTKDWSRDMNR